MTDGTVEIGVDTNASGVTKQVEKLSADLENAYSVALKLRDSFISMANAAERTAQQEADLKKTLDYLRSISAGTALAKNSVLLGASQNGGTLRDDQLVNFQVQALKTAINTSVEQVQARLTEEATKATQRLMKTTADAVQAQLNKTAFDTKNQIATFTNPYQIQALQNRANISAEKIAERFGGVRTLDELRAREKAEAEAANAEKEAIAARREWFAQQKYRLGLMTTEERRQESETRRAAREAAAAQKATDDARKQWFSDQRQRLRLMDAEERRQETENRKAAKAAAEQQKLAKQAEDAYWSDQRRRLQLLANEQRRQEREDAAASRAQANLNRQKAANEQAKSPEARALAFENRLRIFADYATIGGAVLAVKQLLGGIVELDDGLQKFQAITQTSNVEMTTFKTQLLDVAAASRFSVKDLTEVATTLGQTGLTANEVAKALKSVTDLATASGSSLKDAADSITAVLGAYNLEAGRAPDVANTFTAALNKTRLTMTQLNQSLQYTTNIAHESGVSFEELTATIATLAQAGIRSGSTIGTGVRQLFQELTAPSDKLKKTLADLGITFQDIDIKANGFVGVLDNLTAKGFTGADALRSLDLRAASAFTALSSRTSNLKSLQEGMLLSNAAAEGAAKASESLAAVWTQLGNKGLELSSKAFGPLLEIMKALGIAFGAVADAANKMPAGVVSAFGTLIGGAGLVAITGGIANVVRGLLAMETAASAATGAVGALMGVLALARGNPLVTALILGGTAAAGAAAYLTGSGLKEKADEVQATLNKLSSQQQQTEQSTENLDKSIENLINRRDKLNEDPILRRTAITEAQQAFGNLGLSIKNNVTNIDELIAALRTLRGELAQQELGTLGNRSLELRKQLELKKQQADLADQGTLAGITRGSPIAFGSQSQLSNYLNANGAGNLQGLLKFLFTPSSQINTADVRGDIGPLTQNLVERLRGSSSDTELYKVLSALNDQVNEKIKRLSELQSQNLEIDQNERNITRQKILQRLDVQNLIDRTSQAYGGFTQATQAANSLPGYERLDALRGARTTANGLAGDVLKELDIVKARLERDGFSKEQIKEATTKLEDDLQGIIKGTAGQIRTAAEALRDESKLIYNKDERVIKAEIKKATDAVKRTNSIDEIDVTGEMVKQLLEQERDIKMKIIEAESEAGSYKDKAALQIAIDDVNKEFDTQWATYVDSLNQRRKEILAKFADIDNQRLQAQGQAIQSQISELQRELSRPATTADKARELRAKIDELLQQAINVVEVQARLGLTKDRLANSTLATGPVAAQILSGAQGAGAGALGNYLLGLANAESGLNPLAKNPGSSARGLFQFTEDTWKRSGGGDIFDVATQVRNVLKLIGEDFDAFHKRFGRSPDDREMYLLHQQGRAGGLSLLDPANAGRSAIDVLAPLYKSRATAEAAITGNGGSLNQSAAQFAETVMKYFDTKSGLGDKTAKAVDELSKMRADAQKDAATTKARADIEAANAIVQTKAFNELMINERRRNAADERSLQAEKGVLKRTFDDAEAQNAALGILGILKGLLERELADEKAKPEFANLSEADQKDRLDAIRLKSADRATKEIIENSDVIAQKVVAEQQRVVQRLEELAQQQQEKPDRFSGAELEATQQQLKVERDRLDLITPIVAKKRELQLIEEEIAASTRVGLTSETDLIPVTERKLALKKELAALEEKAGIKADAERRGQTFGDAIDSGSFRFFQSAGLYNAAGQFKSLTEEMSDLWTQALGSMSNSMSQLFVDLASGTMKAKDAFRQFAQSVIQSMMQIVSTALANQILRALFAPAGGFLSPSGAGLSGLGSIIPGFALGGMVRHYATGGAGLNRDSVPAMLMPGEYVLRKSAVDAIGRDSLDQINNMGNRRLSQTPTVTTDDQKVAPAVTNVWVVSPDQVPPPSEKDIIVTVAKDMQNHGPLRQMVKSIAVGAV